MTRLHDEFTKILEPFGRRRSLSKAFNELLTMGICAFHRTNIRSCLQEKEEENEALYMDTIKAYSKEELNELSKALGILQLQVHNDPYSDLLGEYFTNHITRGENGQFFTPDTICKLMAAMQGDVPIQGSRVLDPACGSGRMLLNFAEANPDNYFFGADNHNTCAKMATLNFFLNGLRGEVAWLNSLSNEWYGGWHINTNGLGIVPIEKEQSQIWLKAPDPKKDQSSEEQQLTLF